MSKEGKTIWGNEMDGGKEGRHTKFKEKLKWRRGPVQTSKHRQLHRENGREMEPNLIEPGDQPRAICFHGITLPLESHYPSHGRTSHGSISLDESQAARSTFPLMVKPFFSYTVTDVNCCDSCTAFSQERMRGDHSLFGLISSRLKERIDFYAIFECHLKSTQKINCTIENGINCENNMGLYAF